MVLGDNKPDFQTQHNSAYQPVPLSNYHARKGDNSSNITLGKDKGGYISENKQHFAHKEAPKSSVDPSVLRDFRNAHFHLGFPNQENHVSEAQEQFNEKPI